MELGLQPQYPYRKAETAQALLNDDSLTKRELDEALKPMGLRPVEVYIIFNTAHLIVLHASFRTCSGISHIAMYIEHCHVIDCMHIMVVSFLIIFSRSFNKLLRPWEERLL